ncbi:MAG: DUF1736 domain-containing protein [Chlorobi bacterium]|nr:DUF1736 domain-containing protein [Chlorobiota bacterium]
MNFETTQKQIIYFFLIIFTFVLYGNTLHNEYALDDAIVITENNFTKKGFRGIADLFTHDTFTGFFGIKKNLVSGGRYRPLSLVTFAIEYQFFGLNPSVSHLINIILYTLTILLIFKILTELFSSYKPQLWYFTLPLVSSILFMAHPIHTEVIANIKGRDEIMTFLGSLLALYYSIKFIDSNKFKYLVYSSLIFFLALLAKENAITFLAVIPITIYYFKKLDFRSFIKIVTPLLIASFVFLIIRHNIVGTHNKVAYELMNNPFLNANKPEKFATIFYTFLLYFKLLIFPYQLTFDYYPKQIPILNWHNIYPVLSVLLNLLLLIYALLKFRKKTILSYSILFFFITFSIVSNLFFPVGTFMNERFMYISSLAFCIALAYVLVEIFPKIIKNKKNYFPVFLLAVILSLYSFKTINRNKDWKNDFTLFTHDVKISSNSAKSNCSAGGKLLEEATKPQNKKLRNTYLKQSINYLEKSIEIYPTYIDALLLLGNACYEYNKDYVKTFYYYQQILNKNPNYQQVYTNTDIILSKLDSVDFKIKIWERFYSINPDIFEANYNLGNLYGKYKGNIEKSIYYLKKAVTIKPQNSIAWKDLGVAYGIKKDFINSVKALENAVKYNPEDDQSYFNLGITYLRLGNKNKSEFNFKKAVQLNTALKKQLNQ